MEDKRTALAFFISMIVVMIYLEYMFAPYKNHQVTVPQTTVAATTQPPIAPVQPLTPTALAPQANTNTDANAASSASTRPTTAELANAEITTIESNKVIIKINHLGGRISEYLLKDYLKHIGHPDFLNLVVSLDNTPLPLGVYVDNFDDARVTYKLSQINGSARDSSGRINLGDSPVTLTFDGQHPQLGNIKKTLTFKLNSFLFDLTVALDENSSANSNLWIEWLHYVPEQEKSDRMSFNSFALLTDGKIRHVLGADLKEGYSETTAAGWAGFNDKYFLSALVPESKDLNTKLGLFQNTFVTRVAGGLKTGTFHLYMGPKDYTILKELPFDLVKCIDLGWFSVLAHPLLSLLRMLHSVLGNWGLAIIALTLLIKAAFLPLTKQSFTSMKAMQDLQPEMKALRERIKDSNQLNQEMLALYKKRGVNPMGGCLPILIQIPVFLGLYNALLYAIELRHANYGLWVHDLSAPERLQIFGMAIPVMVILMGGLMLLQQYLTPSTGDPMQKKMMMFTSLLFTVFFVGFPAGLTMYWLTNSLISIVQQFSIRDESSWSPGKATLVACVVIMGLAFVLTLI